MSTDGTNLDDELVRVVHFVGDIADRCHDQFPRTCSSCGHQFGTFHQYLTETRPMGYPMEFDPGPYDLFGLVDFANCKCGTTLSLRWEGEPGDERRALRAAIAEDAARTGASPSTILLALRTAIRRATLGAEGR